MNYEKAEQLMQQRKVMHRISWPPGKYVFFDSDADGKPDDPLPLDYPDPVEVFKTQTAAYDFFKANLVVKGASKTDVNNRPWITQADFVAEDWEEYETARN